MYDIIQSNQNKWIKHIKSLQQKKYRDQQGEYIIEGIKLLEEAMQYNAEISFIGFNEKFIDEMESHECVRICQEKHIPYHLIEEKLFYGLCETQTPQGLIAIAAKPEYDLESIFQKEAFSLLVLDEVRDPGNVGTIIRTADACNITAVILSKGSADVYNGKTVRSAMGSIFHIPVITEVDLADLIERLHCLDGHTIGADPHAEVDFFSLPDFQRTAIFIGNEANGLSEAVVHKLKHHVGIPMPGKAESLNAAVAAALMMYEICVRRRLK